MIHKLHIEIPRQHWNPEVLSQNWLEQTRRKLSAVTAIRGIYLHEIRNRIGEPVRLVLAVETTEGHGPANGGFDGFHLALDLMLHQVEELKQARLLGVEV